MALLLGTTAWSRVWWHRIFGLEQQAVLNLDLGLTANTGRERNALGDALKPRRRN